MGKYSEAFVAFDVAKRKHAVAIAEGSRTGEVRFLGDVENSPLPIERTIKRLADRCERLHVCFEAGPTGYGLYRQVQALGHDCMVVAPALIPKRSGERIKTNRGDAVTLARLHRAGELTGVWAPDEAHEAVRDLVRAREAAADDLRRKRQQLLSFLLRHNRIYSGGGHWTFSGDVQSPGAFPGSRYDDRCDSVSQALTDDNCAPMGDLCRGCRALEATRATDPAGRWLLLAFKIPATLNGVGVSLFAESLNSENSRPASPRASRFDRGRDVHC